MDFRTCPACKASVLEDDVADCPFCGASMSGKPSAKAPAKPAAKAAAAPVKAPAAAPAAAPEKPAPKPTGPAKRPVFGQTTADEENPFDIDTNVARKAAPVSPKPTKTRTLAYTCKMCETTGYILPTDAGKDVKCHNPNCLQPIAKAPLPEKKVVVEEKKAGLNPLTMALIGIPLVGAIAFGVMTLMNEEKKEVAGPEIPVTPTPTIKTDEIISDKPTEVVQVVLDAAGVRKKSLETIETVANGQQKDRPQALRLQYASEGRADAGDLKGAAALLGRITSGSKATHFHAIPALVRIAVGHLRAGNQAEAVKHLDSALRYMDTLPTNNRQALDAIAGLSAALVQVGRAPEAAALIKKYNEYSNRGQATLQWMSTTEGGTFSIEDEATRPYHVDVSAPLWVSVVEILVYRGDVGAGLELCKAAEIPGVDARNNCYAGWAGALAGSRGMAAADVDARLTQAIADHALGNIAQARMWSAVASRRAKVGDATAAQASLDKAIAAIGNEPPLTPVALPSMKAIYDSRGRLFGGLPDPAPARSRALAHGDVAQVQTLLGSADAASKSLEQAFAASSAMAPGRSLTKALVEATEKDKAVYEAQLAQALGLKNATPQEMFRTSSTYRTQANALDVEATKRLELESRILRSCISLGLLQPVWDLIKARHEAADPAVQQPLLTTEAAGFLVVKAILLGQQPLTQEVGAALTGAQADIHALDAMTARAYSAMAKNDLKAVANEFDAAYRSAVGAQNPQRIDIEVLRFIEVHTAKLDAKDVLYNLIIKLGDPVVREDACRLLAARTMQAGKASELWYAQQNKLLNHELKNSDRVALLRGFLEVMPSYSASAPPASPVAAKP